MYKITTIIVLFYNLQHLCEITKLIKNRKNYTKLQQYFSKPQQLPIYPNNSTEL